MPEATDWTALLQLLRTENVLFEQVLQQLQQQQRALIGQSPEQIRQQAQACENALQQLEPASQARLAWHQQAGWQKLSEAISASSGHPLHSELESAYTALLQQIQALQNLQYGNLALIQQGQDLTEQTLEMLVGLQQQEHPAVYGDQGQESGNWAPASTAIYDFNV